MICLSLCSRKFASFFGLSYFGLHFFSKCPFYLLNQGFLVVFCIFKFLSDFLWRVHAQQVYFEERFVLWGRQVSRLPSGRLLSHRGWRPLGCAALLRRDRQGHLELPRQSPRPIRHLQAGIHLILLLLRCGSTSTHLHGLTRGTLHISTLWTHSYD